MGVVYDIATEFSRYCGPAVTYESHRFTGKSGSALQGQWLEITYKIGDRQRKICMMLENGTDYAKRRAAHILAGRAMSDAYRLTGQREADMKKLLQGKTL